ncbi:orotidine-5'-phosphate decarboxylase [Cryobacterium melibiosiphilum]|uniref:Orotidine-5'-phosphate decarboxylase n=1 Tax=Cryobacterium melibiosiphilum TaxID=995039 RepID=A0A3A5MH55_9MICO|nr:orotidine-5'-phosphate decarboxylase [Cryobacterium melibiosiphilum]RJT89510.1 orotidine-5'-phosphate decarboxylase [Cryobacterium melibiosiphilum]
MSQAAASHTTTDAAASPFGDRLARVFAEQGRLCVGIDPHAFLLADWDLPDTAAGAESFGRTVVAAAAGSVGIIKPQVAFYERFGSQGYVALERVLQDARDAGLLVIADVKRGDLGTSVDAYGAGWLGAGSPLEVDAITVSAYMGLGSLDGLIDLAAARGKGLFVLAATSNPEAAEIQQAIVAGGPHAGKSVARTILEQVAERNARAAASASNRSQIGSIGVVLGATLDLHDFGIDTTDVASRGLTPVLAPGFGHQGGNISNLVGLYGGYSKSVIVSESRSVLAAGPARLAESIVRRVAEVGAIRG